MATLIKEQLAKFPAWIILALVVSDSVLDVVIAWFQNAPTDLANVPPRDWILLIGLSAKAGGSAAFALMSKAWHKHDETAPTTTDPAI